MTLTAYQQAQQVSQDAVRTAILDRAISLLTTHGHAALTVRRIAAEAGCSTKVLYTLFSGKDGLVDALGREGFARLGRALERVPHHRDPLAHLTALTLAYRAHARAEPAYYEIMFAGFAPGPEASWAALGILESACAACVQAGQAIGDPRQIAVQLWTTVHGAVSLELSGFVGREHGDRLLAAPRLEALLNTGR